MEHIRRARVKLPCLLWIIAAVALAFCQVACAAESPRKSASPKGVAGKSSVPIEISYTVPAASSKGAQIPIIVQISVLADAGSLSVKVVPESGLSLVPEGELTRSYGARSTGSTQSENLTVTSKQDGRFYLNVFATGTFGGRTLTQTTSIPVVVGTGTPAQKPAGRITTDSTGQKIISMPAQEK